ncbi:uncharacterized protein LOC126901813 [Daktulosphaira vitifoliae]|uniref:uncharacterized protein LOC126901813 n=1 Tax=Daktulosphaira vitifoliae TaxID=58002 RepID=UPI0021A9BF61|nr:uncharacterized protein LOC126901813 [Daktulosphaira vitifoliae]
MKDIVDSLKSSSDMSVKTQLRKIASSFSGSQEISAQEAVYTCLGIKQSCTSTGHVFINTNHSDKRTRIVKPIALRGLMKPESTDIFCDGLIEYYSCRPLYYENLTLAEFAADFEIKNKQKSSKKLYNSESDDTIDVESNDDVFYENNVLIGKLNKFMHKRKIRKIIRYVRFSIDKSPADFYRERVMLFFPWRNEYTDIENINCQEVYEKNIEQIQQMYYQFNKIEEEDLEENVNNVEKQQDINETELPDDWVPHDEIMLVVGDFNDNDDAGNSDKNNEINGMFNVHKIDNEQFINLVKCMNEGQRMILYHVTNVLRQQIWGSGAPSILCYVTGPAGAGKSVLIRTLAQSTIRIANLRPDIDDLSLTPVLLTAPTGKAAYGIRGLTLHAAFKLPINQFSGILPKLGADISNTLRCQLANVKLLIIDEISMVGLKTLGYIDQRLRHILRIDKPFGDINVIVFGDFYQLTPVLSTPLYEYFDQIVAKYPTAIELISTKATWETFQFYELTEIMRQRDDKEFSEVLTKLARGGLTKKDIAFFMKLVKPLEISFQPGVMHL